MTDFTYVISEDENNHLVILVVQGSLNKHDGEKVIKETRALATEKQCGILCDITNATINVNSTTIVTEVFDYHTVLYSSVNRPKQSYTTT